MLTFIPIVMFSTIWATFCLTMKIWLYTLIQCADSHRFELSILPHRVPSAAARSTPSNQIGVEQAAFHLAPFLWGARQHTPPRASYVSGGDRRSGGECAHSHSRAQIGKKEKLAKIWILCESFVEEVSVRRTVCKFEPARPRSTTK